MKLNLLYDKETIENYKGGWGYSLWIEKNSEHILFDTGWNSSILLHNIKQRKLPIEKIQIIFLSHHHWDHIGGVMGILEEINNKGIKPHVIVPRSFSNNLKKELKSLSFVMECSRGLKEIKSDIYTTGELGTSIKEHSMVVKQEKGFVIITGCAHPGLGTIIDTVQDSLGEIYAILGGFHGYQDIERLRSFPIIVPQHCTQKKKEILAFTNSKEMKVGDELEL